MSGTTVHGGTPSVAVGGTPPGAHPTAPRRTGGSTSTGPPDPTTPRERAAPATTPGERPDPTATAAEPRRRRLITGLTPSGRLHLGNYLGAIRPLVALSRDGGNDTLTFVSDLHALTVPHDPAQLRERIRELAATLLACDLDERAGLFVQSAVPAHAELAQLLESTATVGELSRMIQFKEKSGGDGASGTVRASLFTYPVLMAADILVHRVDAVPVGQDQRQHLELTRALAQRFNSHYGEVFTVPEGLTPPAAARVRDLRDPASKMGKSAAAAGQEAGVVHLLDPPVRLAAAVRRAVTDLDPVLGYDPELRPGVANLAEILAALTNRTPQQALRGLHGAGALKSAVTEALVEALRPVRERRAEIAADPGTVDAVLARGALRAAESAAPTLAAARHALGVG